jgi:hypothetical protein
MRGLSLFHLQIREHLEMEIEMSHFMAIFLEMKTRDRLGRFRSLKYMIIGDSLDTDAVR